MEYARVEFDEKANPRSQTYGDIYYAVEDGLRESRYVFLDGNQLSQRWQDKNLFTVGEIGFGTGLNFLNTWNLCKQTARRPRRLHYLSCENNPLHPRDLERAILPYSELRHLLKCLLHQYPEPVPGYHRLKFENGRVSLTLLYGDALQNLQNLRASIHAWYLDGFAPNVNPDLWSEELFKEIARLTAVQGTFATFSSASRVRKGLQAAGFAVEKLRGFGRKREMCRGKFLLPAREPAPARPGFDYPPAPEIRSKKALIIGAGLAGCSTAYALANRGWEVILYDRHSQIAGEASGNRTGILFPHFNAEMDSMSRFYWSGWTFIQDLWKNFCEQGTDLRGQELGLLLLEQKNGDAQRFERILTTLNLPSGILFRVNRSEASQICGIPVARSGLFFNKGTCLSPLDLCRALIQHPGIHLKLENEILGFEYSEGEWKVREKNSTNFDSAEVLILTNAYEAARFPLTRFLHLETIRGQVTHLSNPQGLSGLKTILNYGGYVLPGEEGHWTVGATYNRKYKNLKLAEGEHRQNLELLKKFVPGFSFPKDLSSYEGRVSLRTVTRDRWPVVGPIPNEHIFLEVFRDLRHGRKKTYPSSPFHPGLYANVAHGSKGLLSAPLTGEFLASYLNNEPWNLETSVVEAMHPNRFLLKKLIRREV